MALLENLTAAQPFKKFSPPFMETKLSLPRSHQPATGQYPGPDETSTPYFSLLSFFFKKKK
jgi:hypothetical protein